MGSARFASVRDTWQVHLWVVLASAGWSLMAMGGMPSHQPRHGVNAGGPGVIAPAAPPKSTEMARGGSVDPVPGAGPDWFTKVQETIRKDEYQITWSDLTGLRDLPSAYQAPNRAQGFRTYFTDTGLKVVPRGQENPAWEWTLGIGDPKPQTPYVSAARAEYRTSRATLAAENAPRGLVLTWTVITAPQQDAEATPKRTILASLHSGGSLVASLAGDARSLDLRLPHGGMSGLHLGSLRATDAHGKALDVLIAGPIPGQSGLALVTSEESSAFPHPHRLRAED